MASRDYILCKFCNIKLVYDGYDNIRDSLEQTYGTRTLVCPDCLKVLEDIIRRQNAALKGAGIDDVPDTETKIPPCT